MNKNNLISAIEGVTQKFAKANPNQYVHVVTAEDTITIQLGGRDALREKWVRDKLAFIAEEEHRNCLSVDIVVDDPRRKIMVVNFYEVYDAPYTGVALCSPTDTYDHDTGLAVAYANAYGEEIPDFI